MITVIWSSPQSGKTTIACELALSMGAQGKKVCIISAEDYGEMGLRFGKAVPAEHSIVWVAKNPQEIRSIVYPVTENVFLLAPSTSDSSLSLTFSESQASGILRTASAIYDEVIVDCTTWKANAITGVSISLAKTMLIPIPGKVSALPWFIANKQTLEQKKDISIYFKNETIQEFDYELLIKSLPGIEPTITIPYVPGMMNMQNEGALVGNAQSFNKHGKTYKKAINLLVSKI